MTKRLFELTLCSTLALLFLAAATNVRASDLRETPMVRAVKRVKASIANIHSEKTTLPGESLFSTGKGRKVNGMGTGIIIDPRGYIVTNHHVVNGVDALRVTLLDGSTYDAKIVSYDRKHDLAVIKIPSSRPLPVIPIGTSSDIMLGETVLAIGNAFGYEHSVTAGIVSALSRDVEVNQEQSYENLIQTDASINPGNSGGPLINLDGEVIGINVAIRAGAQRIGFAIPIDDARQVVADLLNVEQLNHNYHGLLARDRKSGENRQLVVASAQPDSPAKDAGFREGDVVLKAADVDVVDRADFERALLGRSAGEAVEIVIRRDNQTSTLSLVLADLDGRTPSASGTRIVAGESPTDDSAVFEAWTRFGLRLSRLSERERRLVGEQYRGGLRIAAVRPKSPASKNGIQPGDILVGLHIWETVNYENVSYVLEHPQLSTFDPLKFYIIRNHETLYGYLRLAE